MTDSEFAFAGADIERLGVALAPRDDPREIEGVLNPASARTRDGKLVLYPRAVAAGNVSRVGIYEASGSPERPSFAFAGYALEPAQAYEERDVAGGYGCEDPRVTFVPVLDAYVMCYTAFGPAGPRIALALSPDAYAWERLGLVDFSAPGLPNGDDKDAAFFPEPVVSPAGVPSLAFYHRPMQHIPALDVCAAAPLILARAPRDREGTRIAYVPLDAVLRDRRALLRVAESAAVLDADDAWGRIKNGGGTPPVRVDEGWLSFFHGVDVKNDANGRCVGVEYRAGIVVHDAQRPHVVRYRSPAPVLAPQTPDEMHGMVHNVVFPTAIDRRPGDDARSYDVYYGMADSRVGRARVRLHAARAQRDAESAA